MIQIELDAGNEKSLYLQIRDQIISLIDKGVLKAGNRLPATRELSSKLKINRSTVYKAYKELWSLGYIDSRPGSYSTVRNRRSLVQFNKRNTKTPAWLRTLPPLHDCFTIHFDEKKRLYDFRSFSPDPWRMHAALSALDQYFPAELGSYTKPSGGYSLWVTLKDSFPEEDVVCARLTTEGIGVRPGRFSLLTPASNPSFRLSIAHLGEIEIENGLQAMGRILSEMHKEYNNG